jgi:PAS domain S-box-containing protein
LNQNFSRWLRPWLVLVGALLLTVVASALLWTRDEFNQTSNRSLAIYMFAGGLLVSLILFWLARAQTRARRQIGAAASELRQSQQALSESEEQYRTITETASDTIVTVDDDSTILFVNRAAETTFGYNIEEMINQPMTMLVPDYQVQLLAVGPKVSRPLAQEGAARKGADVTGLHKDGREIPLEISFGKFSRAGHTYYTCVVRDITERKQAERGLAERTRLTELSADVSAALTQSETLQDNLRQCTEALVKHLDAAFARIWTLNEAERVLELQASSGLYTHIDGGHARVPVGKFKIGLIAEERLPHLTNDVMNDPRVGDREWAKREGMVAFAGYPLIVEGRLVGVMALFARQPLTEVTLRAMGAVANGIALGIQRKWGENELRESEERLRALVNSVPQLAWMAEANGHIFWYNQRWYEYTGTTPEQMEGGGWQSVHDPEMLPRVMERWKTCLQTGNEFEMEFPLRGADGVFRWFLTRVSPLRDAHGHVIRWFGTNTDVDDLRKTREALRDARDQLEARVIERTRQLADANTGLMEQIHHRIQAEDALQALNQELQRSNRELQDFAFVASHDLQEPLRKIQAFGDLLLNQYADALGEEGRDFLTRMQKASRRMHVLINDLLTFSRVTTKAMPFTPVDLNQVAAEVLEDLEARLRQTGGKVETGPLPTVEADPLQMRQLLQNLIGNALKFHRPGEPPVVWIGAESDGNGQVRLHIEDNGIGFDEKYLDRIFTPFQRLHARGEYEGTGMGLAVCRKIVERHGGQITARSHPGQGTTFLVTVPLSQPGSKTDECATGNH